MSEIALLAQALPSASPGVNWLYQFTNNLTNLTTQNGGALTQLGLTELSAISLFVLISMVINWNTTGMTLRFHTQPVRVGDMTNFLLRLMICCLLENYWVNPFPGASFGINHFFSYIAQSMVAVFDQNSLDNLLQLLKTAGDNTAMPSITAPIQILCYILVQVLLGLASAILFCTVAYDENFPIEVLSLPRRTDRFCDDPGSRRCLHLRVGRLHERLHSADVQW
jgi:hypothetical protein